jgi:hypothetical protein
MFLGSVSSAYNQVKLHTKNINDLKKKHHFYAEIKWTSVEEPCGIRTYIYDCNEKYVIVLEPMRDVRKQEYALLTAYHEDGKDKERSKIMKKYKRKLPEVL